MLFHPPRMLGLRRLARNDRTIDEHAVVQTCFMWLVPSVDVAVAHGAVRPQGFSLMDGISGRRPRASRHEGYLGRGRAEREGVGGAGGVV